MRFRSLDSIQGFGELSVSRGRVGYSEWREDWLKGKLGFDAEVVGIWKYIG